MADMPVEAPQSLEDTHVKMFDISGKAPEKVSIPHDQITEAVSSGNYTFPKGYQVKALSPEGEPVTIDAANAPDAFKNGYKYATPKDIDEVTYGTPLQQVKTGAEGLAQGVLGPLAPLAERALGVEPEAMRKRAEVNPYTHGISEGVGFIAPAVATAGTGLAAKLGLQAASKALPAMEVANTFNQGHVATQFGEMAAKALGMGGEATSLAGKLATGGAKMGAEMALFSAGDEATKLIQQDPNQNAETALANIGAGALFGGALGAGGVGVKELWKATAGKKLAETLSNIKNDANGLPNMDSKVNKGVAKAVSVATNMPVKDVEEYMANRAMVNAAPESEEIYNHVLGRVNHLTETAENAKDAFKELQKDTFAAHKEAGFDARNARKAAEHDLSIAQKDLAKSHLDNALGAASDIANAHEALYDSALKDSDAAYELLAQHAQPVSLKGMIDKGVEIADDLYKMGTDESKAKAERLLSYLGDKPEEISALDAKSLLKGLDVNSKWDRTVPAYADMSSYYKQLRFAIDSELKHAERGVPGYKKAMAPVAEKFKLLNQLEKLKYNTEEGATTRLKSIRDSARYKNEMPLLRELEQKTGTNLTGSIEPYANPELQKKYMDALPEYKEALKAAELDSHLKDPRVLQDIKAELANSAEHKAHMKAQEELGQINGLTERNVASKIRQGQLGKKDALATLAKLPDVEGMSLPDALKYSKTKEAFDKGYGAGSKLVNMYGAAIGSGASAILGHPGVGMGVGAVLGGYADKFGPQAVKKLLDKYLDHFGSVAEGLGKGAANDTAHAALARFLDKDAVLTTGGKIDLGSTPDAQGFKSMADFIQHVSDGEKLINKATKNVFHPGVTDVLPSKHRPSEREIKTLEKHLENYWKIDDDIGKAADHVSNMTQGLGSYMPEQQQASSQMAANVANYLKSQKPITRTSALLDTKPPLTKADQMAWARTLGIAQQPLIVLEDIKKGTLTTKDVIDFKSMYPALHAKLSQGLVSSMMDEVTKGHAIAYKTRMSASLFVGQPLDSTLTPQGIQGAQPVPKQQEQMAQGPQGQQSPKHSNTALNKMPAMYQTPGQARNSKQQSDKK